MLGADRAWWSVRSSKPLGGACGGSGGFDSHTLPPPARAGRTRQWALAVAAAVLFATSAAHAQVPFPTPTPQRPDSAQVADTVKVPAFRVEPPISPLGAFARSFLLPGWGQSLLGRRVTGAFFVFFEGIAITMTLKAVHQLSYLEAIDDAERVESKKQEIQDWAVVLVFNHLVAGAEAYVSANLWDFPVELEVRALGPGRAGLGLRVPVR